MNILATLWLQSMALVYVLIGVALYLDKDRERIRRHCASPRMLALKFAFAPVTLVVIAAYILTALPRYLWGERLVGCKAGNRPIVLGGTNGRDLGEARQRRAEAIEADREARRDWQRLDAGAEIRGQRPEIRTQAPVPACSAGVATTAVDLARGPYSVVRDDRLAEVEEVNHA